MNFWQNRILYNEKISETKYAGEKYDKGSRCCGASEEIEMTIGQSRSYKNERKNPRECRGYKGCKQGRRVDKIRKLKLLKIIIITILFSLILFETNLFINKTVFLQL